MDRVVRFGMSKCRVLVEWSRSHEVRRFCFAGVKEGKEWSERYKNAWTHWLEYKRNVQR